MNLNDYKIVTDSLPPEKAREVFRHFLRKIGLDLQDVDLDTDIVIDSFRTSDGQTLHRYRIRKQIIE